MHTYNAAQQFQSRWKANQISGFFFGDATGGRAVWMQRRDSCVTDREDIKEEKNSK